MPADRKAVNATASLFIKSLLLGIDHSLQKKQKSAKFDDTVDADDIEILPFQEALEYMQKKLPMGADEYYKLSDKARFRAFTVARLTDGDSLKKAKTLLEKSIAEGGTLTEFLKKTDTELLGELGLAGTNGGWYWENVYRTNVQTAYNTGRAIGFENVKPLALELVGIGDSRQTELCRSLTQPPVRRPYGDEFWQRYWPPLHFSCRTTVRAIYDPAELKEEPITRIPNGIEKHRAKGFGTYPIDSDSWWEELPSMKRRAVAYGVQGEIEKVRKMLFSEKTLKILETQEPVNEKIFIQVKRNLERQGFTIQCDQETDIYLEKRGQEACVISTSDGKPIILFHSKLSASGMYEELIHLTQINKMQTTILDGKEYLIELSEKEIEAKEKLLRNSKAYGITEYEIDIIKESINDYRQRIRRLKNDV